jgi:hypothetical protein
MSITARTPNTICKNCIAFEASSFSSGFCHLYPGVFRKEEDDWCAQFTLSRAADTTKPAKPKTVESESKVKKLPKELPSTTITLGKTKP